MSTSMIPGGDRHAKWERRYDPAHIKTVTEVEKPIYSAHAATKFNELYEMELAVKQVLNSIGVSVKDVANYLAFAREVWKADKTHDGETLKQETAVLVAKWVGRLLTQSVLETIRNDVFHISAPTPA